MRAIVSSLLLSGFLAAQYNGEPPVLITDPPQNTSVFGAAALGATQVAQINLTPMRDAAGNFVPNTFYVTATVVTASRATWHGYSGTWNSVSGTHTPTSDFGNMNAVNTSDMFAFNVSGDGLVAVADAGTGFQPICATRSNMTQPFANIQSIAGVPSGFVDSQIYDGPDGNSEYQFAYISGNNFATINFNPATGATSGTPVIRFTGSTTSHSQAPLRVYSNLAAETRGTPRGQIGSVNSNAADPWFRSTVESTANTPAIPNYQMWTNTNWLANPGHIGGRYIYARASTTYGDPLQLDTVSTMSVRVQRGTPFTLIAMAPPSVAPTPGFMVIGNLGSAGIDLSFLGVTGKLSLSPVGFLVFPLTYDGDFGTAVLPIGGVGPGTVHMQAGALIGGRIYLGNTAEARIL